MALDKDTLTEIKAYMDGRAEAWRLAANSSAQDAARQEVRAADERIAKRNTVFGVGIGAVVLSSVGFGYASITRSVTSIAETAKAQVVATATNTAKSVAEMQLIEGADLIEKQKDQISALIDGRLDMARELGKALAEVERGVFDAQTTLKSASETLSDLQNRTAEASAAASETQGLVARLSIAEAKVDASLKSLESRIPGIEATLKEAGERLNELDNLTLGLADAKALVEQIKQSEQDIVTAVLENGTIQSALVAAAGLPKDSIVVVDSRNGCPTGWTEFTSAAGRTIIGVGQGYVDRIGDQDERLTNRVWRESGGEETVTLTISQMPVHAHNYTFVGSDGNDMAWGKGAARPNRPTSEAGGNQPHNNMPPYIALYFCKKD